MSTEERIRNARRRKKFSVSVGAVIFAFAVVGVVSALFWTTGLVRGWLDDSDERVKYENFILPVVMTDPVPFENAKNIDEVTLLETALWASLLGENRANYAYDENGLLLVPSSDLDVAAKNLFGPDVTLTHRTFDDVDGIYLFDPEIGAYRVPLVAKLAYSPSVEEITKNTDTITLRVGYIAPGNIFMNNDQGEKKKPAPEKYMLFELKKTEKGYYISAVRDVPNAVPVS